MTDAESEHDRFHELIERVLACFVFEMPGNEPGQTAVSGVIGPSPKDLAKKIMWSIGPEIEQILVQRDAYLQQWQGTQEDLTLTRTEALEALAEQRERFELLIEQAREEGWDSGWTCAGGGDD